MIERFKNRKLDQQETKVLGHIESHGWSVTNIGEEHGRPGWSFTIGLFENYGHPEVILFGQRKPPSDPELDRRECARRQEFRRRQRA